MELSVSGSALAKQQLLVAGVAGVGGVLFVHALVRCFLVVLVADIGGGCGGIVAAEKVLVFAVALRLLLARIKKSFYI